MKNSRLRLELIRILLRFVTKIGCGLSLLLICMYPMAECHYTCWQNDKKRLKLTNAVFRGDVGQIADVLKDPPCLNFNTSTGIVRLAALNQNIALLKSAQKIHIRYVLLELIQAKEKNLKAIDFLLQNGAKIHDPKHKPDCWSIAVASGDVEFVTHLLNQKADIRADRNSALIESSARGDLEMVKLLLSRGAQVNACNDKPIKVAAAGGHDKVVKILHENGANIRVNDDEPLLNAAMNNHMNVVKSIIALGAPYVIVSVKNKVIEIRKKVSPPLCVINY